MADEARDYVAQLYQKELGRTGSAADILKADAGMQYWIDALASGRMSKADVANAINRSAEGTQYDIGAAYQKELGRTGSAADILKADAGMQYWVDAVSSGQMTMEEAQRAIARSQEGATYDVNRVYQSELKRAPDEGGAEYWRNQLMRGEITEEQFLNAVRASDEYKKLQATPTPPPPPPPTPTPTPTNPNQDMVRYQNQLEALQKQAIENANTGYFQPVFPVPTYSAPAQAGLPPAQAPSAPTQTAQGITPAPAVSVPMTYLSPAPPQYRNIDPFQSPFSTSFQSYFDIANARPQMSYPSPFVAQPSAQPTPGQAQTMSPYPYPFQYYQGMYSSPQAQTSLPAPAGPTTPTT